MNVPKKTYLILSDNLNNSDFKDIFPEKSWKAVTKKNKNINFIYVDGYYRRNKDLYNIKTDYISLLKYNINFDDKDILHKLVKKNNKLIYNKYFLEQYDSNEFTKKHFSKNTLWIIKPYPGGEGFGIKIINKYNDLNKYISGFKNKWKNVVNINKWVIQKYINNPLLLHNKKFHIRINFMVSIVNGNKSSELFGDYPMIPAKSDFKLTNINNKNIHNTHVKNMNLIKRYPSDFKEIFGETNYKNINKQIIELYNYIYSILDFECYTGTKNCYQFIGMDIMITNDFKVKCLELNMTPGLKFSDNNKKKFVRLIIKNLKLNKYNNFKNISKNIIKNTNTSKNIIKNTNTSKNIIKNIIYIKKIVKIYLYNNQYLSQDAFYGNNKIKLFGRNYCIKDDNYNIFRFNDLLKIFIYKYIQDKKSNDFKEILLSFHKYDFKFISSNSKNNIKYNTKYMINIKNDESFKNYYLSYKNTLKKLEIIDYLNLRDINYSKYIDKLMKINKFNNSLNLSKPDLYTMPTSKNNVKNSIKNNVKNSIKNNVKNSIKNNVKNSIKNNSKNNIKNKVKNNSNNNMKSNDYPLMKDIVSEKDIDKRIENIKYYVSNFYYDNDKLTLYNLYKSTHINDINISSYYDEKKYKSYWDKNKSKIIKEGILNISDKLYNKYNEDNVLYFETTIIALCDRYLSKSVLDLRMTTPKRLIGSCIRNIKYIGIANKSKQKNYNKYIKKYGNKNQVIINKLNDMSKKVNIIILDIIGKEKSKYLKKISSLWNKLTNKGVFIIICNINDNNLNIKFLKNKQSEIIYFNNQKIKVYFKTNKNNKNNKNNNKNKKTYLILSKYFNGFDKYFPKNWVKMGPNAKYVDFLYGDSLFVSDKLFYSLKSNIKSKGIYDKNPNKNFNDKGVLHNFVKKDNPKIFNKYFMEQHDIINLNNLSKYDSLFSKLFKKHKYWIVKPEPGGQGIGIKLFDNKVKLIDYMSKYTGKFRGKKTNKWVLQKYIDNPLLIPQSNKKFHLRFIFMVMNIGGKIECYLFKDGCFYPSKYAYTLKKLDFDIHDTHGSATKINEKGFFPEYFKELYGKSKTNKVYEDLINIFKYISSIIEFECYKKESKNCFHLIGADIMITDNFETKLIELNMEPGFRPFMWFPKKGEFFKKELLEITLNKSPKNIKHFIKV